MTSTNENTEQPELLYIAGVNAKYYSNFGKCLQLLIN